MQRARCSTAYGLSSPSLRALIGYPILARDATSMSPAGNIKTSLLLDIVVVASILRSCVAATAQFACFGTGPTPLTGFVTYTVLGGGRADP